MNVTEYIKSNAELSNLANQYYNKSFNDIVSGTNLFKFDDIIDDDEYGPNTKVIYVNGDREDPWPIADIISYYDEKEVPEERRELWKQYMSQYDFKDVTYYNIRNTLSRMKDKLK